MTPPQSAALLPPYAVADASLAERQFRLLAETLPQIVLTTDADGNATWQNQRWVEYTGLELPGTLGEGWLAAIHPEDTTSFQDRWEAARQTNEPFELSHRLRAQSGEFGWFRSRMEPLPSEPPAPTSWFCICTPRSVTDPAGLGRVQSEVRGPQQNAIVHHGQALEALPRVTVDDPEALFRMTFENAAVGMAHVAPDGHWLRVNDRLCEITGYSREQLLTLTFGEITHPEDLQADWEQAQALLQGRTSNYSTEKRYLRPDGSTVWVVLSVSVQRREDGQPDFFISTIQDITKRKEAEAALRESEAFVRSVFESSSDCIKILDLEGRLLDMNGPGQQIMEVDNLDSVRSLNWLGMWSAPASEPAREAVEVARAGGNGRFQGFCPTMKGKLKFWDVTVTPVLGNKGAPIRLLSVSRDVTEQREAAEAFRITSERFRTALKSSPVVVFNLDQDLRYTWIENPPPGLAAEDIVGRKSSDLLESAEEAAEIDALMHGVLESGRGESREICLSVGGSELFFDFTVEPFRDAAGEIVGVTCAAVNVTERRNAEAQLRDREHFLNHVIEVMPGSLHIFDVVEQRNVFVSSGISAALGYRPEDFPDFTGEALTRLLHPEDRPRFREHMERVKKLREGETAELEFRLRDRWGKERWFQSTDTVFTRDEAGAVRQAIGAAREITERKRAEVALRAALVGVEEARTQLRQIVEHLPVGVLVAEVSGEVAVLNNALAQIWRGSRTQEGKLLYPEYRAWHIGSGEPLQPHEWPLGATIATGEAQPSREIQIERFDGSRGVILTSAVPIKDAAGNLTHAVAVAADITERTEMEQALRRSEARLRRIFDANLVGLLYAHMDGRFLSANDKFLDLVGYSRDELEAGELHARRLTPPDHLEVSWRAQRQLRERGAAPLYEKEYVRKDGSRVPVLIGTTMLEDAGDMVVAFVLDLSQQKQTEAKLSAANASLATALKRERNIAVALQQSLTQMPPEDSFAGYQFHAVYEPAWEEADVGGDFVDAFLLDDDRLAVVVGDVSGKGLRAAARTAEIKYSLRGMLHERRSPAAALNGLNEYFCDSRRRGTESVDEFICLSLAIIDRNTGGVVLSTAGSEPPLYVRASGDTEESTVRGTPLGVFAEMQYREEERMLGTGDLLVLTTDGITEARRGGEFFGYEGLTRSVTNRRLVPELTQLADELVAEAKEFAGGALHDDTCLLLVRRL